MGFMLANATIERLGGAVRVADREGGGTWLQVDVAVGVGRRTMSSQATARSTDGPTLLLVDDDALFRDVLSRALRKRGYVVVTAADVPSALAVADASRPNTRSSISRCPARRV